MVALIERVSRGESGAATVTRQALRDAAPTKKAGRPKAFTFQYRAPTKAFSLKLNFKKSQVEKTEIISALENIIESLRRGEEPAMA